MIKTPLSTVIGGAFWTPGATILGSSSKNLSQLIKSLFSLGEQGFAYDPNDLTTLYQDAAGTIPVTAAGQPVGLMKDKSGRNNHAYQTVSASRPLLQRNATTGAYYLAFDGADDFLQTNSIDFTATDKVSLFAGVRKLSDADAGTLLEFSSAISNVGTFALQAPSAVNGQDYLARANGTPSLIGNARYSGVVAPHSAILTSLINLSEADKREVSLRVNNSAYSYNSTAINGGNFSSSTLYIGRRAGASFPFNGHIYSLIGIARLTTNAETLALEKAIAKLTGVTLNV